MSDPWKHRSAGMLCATCMWFVEKVRAIEGERYPAEDDEDHPDVDREARLGRCRRRAPTMNGYPAVFEHDWCGDHKLDENAT